MMNNDEKPSAAIAATSNSAEDGREETDADAIIEALRDLESTIQTLKSLNLKAAESTEYVRALESTIQELCIAESNSSPTTNLVFLGDNGDFSIHEDDYHGLFEFYRRMGIRDEDVNNEIQDGRGCFSVSGEERRVCKFECSNVELSTCMSLPFSLRVRMNSLTHLTLKEECTMLPGNVGGALRYITHLDLNKSSVRSIPSGIKSLQNLQVFKSGPVISSLPVEIGELTNLKILELFSSDIQSLPTSIGNLQNLEELALSCTETLSLPVEIGDLTNLKILALYTFDIQPLPSSIGKLQNLEELVLSCYENLSLPEEIGELTNLKILNLEPSRVQSLPSSIGNLQNLQFLRASFCNSLDLSQDPDAFLLAIAKSLRFLGDFLYDHEGIVTAEVKGRIIATAEGKGKIDHQLACNRARFRTQSMRTKQELWPCMLCNAPKAFAAYDEWYQYCPEKPTCIYNILAEGMGYFIEIIENRN